MRKLGCAVVVLCGALSAAIVLRACHDVVLAETVYKDSPQAVEGIKMRTDHFLERLKMPLPEIDSTCLYVRGQSKSDYWMRFRVVDEEAFAALRRGLRENYPPGEKCRWDPPKAIREWWDWHGKAQTETYSIDRNYRVVTLDVPNRVVYYADPDY